MAKYRTTSVLLLSLLMLCCVVSCNSAPAAPVTTPKPTPSPTDSVAKPPTPPPRPTLQTPTPTITLTPTPTTKAPTQVNETYYIFQMVGTQTLSLKTVGIWKGQDSDIIQFSLDKSPAVINYRYTSTSSIQSSFDFGLQGGNSGRYPKLNSEYWLKEMAPENHTNIAGQKIGSIVIKDTGKFRMKVTSYGCSWEVKLGVE